VNSVIPPDTPGSDRFYFLPAGFLALAVVWGGLRAWGALAGFSILFLVYLAFFDENFSFSGLGVWGLLAAWLAAAVAFSPEPLNSFWQFSRYLLLFSFFIFSSRRAPPARRIWVWAVFLLGAIAAGVSIFESAAGMTPGDVLGLNPNYSSAFMAAAFAGTAALLLSRAGDKKSRLFSAVAAAFFLAGILLSNSRGGLLAALIAVFYLFCLKKDWRAALYLTAGLLFVTILIPKEQFGWILKLDSDFSLERLKIWRAALGAISGSPLFGYGPGLFERVFEVFKFPFYNGVSYYGHFTPHAHSELLNLAAEAGIPAAALFAWGWGREVFTIDDADRWGTALKVFAVALFAQSAVDIIFYSGAIQLFFFGTLGLLAAGKAGRVDAPGLRVRTLSLLIICWGSAFILRFGFERDKACALNSGAVLSAREVCLKKARVFAPGDGSLSRASIPLSLEVYENYAYTAALAGEISSSRPRDPFLVFARAQAFYMAGALRPAKAEFYRVLAVEPGFLRARLALAEILTAEKKYQPADAQVLRIEAQLVKKRSAAPTSYDLELLALPAASYAKIKRMLSEARKQVL
jgi:O-antigen ligase